MLAMLPKSRLAIASTLTLSTLLSLGKAPALAEGSAQIGVDQRIIQYGITYDNTSSGVFSPNHAIYVDITNPGEVINISACGRNNTDVTRIEIHSTTPNVTDPVLVPNTGTLLFSQTYAGGNIDCNNPLTGVLPSTGPFVPQQFSPATTGTYEVRLFNETQAADPDPDVNFRPLLHLVDVTVTSSSTAPVDPTARQGRIYSYSWAYNAEGFGSDKAADTDYFVKVPGGRAGENFVWLLDLNNFAGFAYEMVANNLGLESPFEGLSAPFDPQTPIPPFDNSSNKINPLFPLYLSYPEVVGTRPTLPPEVTNFRFTDEDGIDNSISPGSTGGVQDTGTFSFNTDVDGTYVIIIDADQDGIYAPGDTFIFGEAVPGPGNTAVWDGRDNNGNVLPDGTYSAQLQVRLGEFHFVAADAETSGGGIDNGLTVFEALNSSSTVDTQVYWDDFTILGATTTLPDGLPSSSARHTWGNFTGGGFGNRNFIDTYVYGDSTTVTSAAVIGSTDTPIERDYGDAPDTGPNGTDNTNYNTTEADAGPNHIITSGLAIGTAPDADDGTQQNTAADEDDDTSSSDEGSITLPLLQTDATTYTVSNIAVTNTTADPAFLVGWIDFDQSGSFDPDEQATATVAAAGTTADLVWNTVPADIVAGTTYARFRFSSVDGLSPTGGAIDGEVEDYRIAITTTIVSTSVPSCPAAWYSLINWGTDAPPFANPLNTPTTNVYRKAGIDTTITVSPGGHAGFTPSYVAYSPTYSVDAGGNPIVEAGYVDFEFTFARPVDQIRWYWTDFDSNESGTAFGELNGVRVTPAIEDGPFNTVTVDKVVNPDGSVTFERPSGQNNLTGDEETAVFIGFDVPVDRIVVRHTPRQLSVGTGSGTLGVGDLQMCADLGDAPDAGTGTSTDDYQTLVSDDGPLHIINGPVGLGAVIDDGDTDGFGDGVDDNGDASDDVGDDGVQLGGTTLQGQSLTPGEDITLDVTTAGSGTLTAWFDWNADGDFADTDEQVAADVAPAANVVTLPITVPATAAPGNTYARFRYSSDSGLTPEGAASDGEVEDYQLSISASVADVLLVKRITAINGATTNPNDGTDLTLVEDDTVSSQPTNDNHPNWPSNYLVGALDAGAVRPGDEIEYTIYFLNAGSLDATDVRLCDRLTPNQTILPDAYGTGVIAQLQLGTSAVLDLTGDSDASDRTEFVAAAASVPATCNLQGPNDDGTLIIDVTGAPSTGDPELTAFPGSTAPGTPNDAYGLFRFTTVVDP